MSENQKMIDIHSIFKGRMSYERKDDEIPTFSIKNAIPKTLNSSFAYRV